MRDSEYLVEVPMPMHSIIRIVDVVEKVGDDEGNMDPSIVLHPLQAPWNRPRTTPEHSIIRSLGDSCGNLKD